MISETESFYCFEWPDGHRTILSWTDVNDGGACVERVLAHCDANLCKAMGRLPEDQARAWLADEPTAFAI